MPEFIGVVSNGSKILIWKQITTVVMSAKLIRSCFQWFKDTNLKANHNDIESAPICLAVVSNGSKILIWKQITTTLPSVQLMLRCFQWFKDTNLKANHNRTFGKHSRNEVVSNGSKILIWKQITTQCNLVLRLCRCFQWFKDTNLKANHNYYDSYRWYQLLFPMVQRY